MKTDQKSKWKSLNTADEKNKGENFSEISNFTCILKGEVKHLENIKEDIQKCAGKGLWRHHSY